MSDRTFATPAEILIHKNNLRVAAEKLGNKRLIDQTLNLAATNKQLRSRGDEEWLEILVQEMHTRFD